MSLASFENLGLGLKFLSLQTRDTNACLLFLELRPRSGSRIFFPPKMQVLCSFWVKGAREAGEALLSFPVTLVLF